MECSYKTQNTCCREIRFNLDKNIVTNVEFLYGGCPGNLKALPRLVEGLTVSEIITKLEGIKCGLKGTSCAAELAKAVEIAYQDSLNKVQKNMKIAKPKINIYEEKELIDINSKEDISNYKFIKTPDKYIEINNSTIDSCIFENIDFTNIDLKNIDLY